MTGQKLLHYQILGKLGEGGMGIVYKARDLHLDRLVAVKVLPPDKVADPERRARFVQEAKAASALHHPSIVTIHDIAYDAGHDFIVMEYVAGKTLDQLIGRKGLKLNDAVRYAIQTAGALASAHAAGIIHRDLKPSNIMVDEHGVVRVLDFGLAKLTEATPGDDEPTMAVGPKTDEGTIIGTASYMSPEQAEGKPVDARSDVFSFGAVLYEMLCGQRAFMGESRVSTLAAILNRDPAPLGDEIPKELERIVARCLRKDPARRWHSMTDVKVAIEDVKEESESGRLTPVMKTTRRRAVWPIALATLMLIVAAGLGWMWHIHRDSEAAPTLFESVPLTGYSGYQFAPSFSPDGSQVAFVWCRDPVADTSCAIYVKQIGVEEPYRLSKPPDNAVSPQWSPDGTYIAFRREIDHPQSHYQYVVLPQRGGAERVVAEFPAPTPLFYAYGRGGGITWTRDSKSLVVVGAESSDRNSRLYAVSLSTGESHRILDAPATAADVAPAISPDGKWLAFSRASSVFQADLYLVALKDGLLPATPPVRLNTNADVANSDATWMPDSHELLFSSGGENGLALFRITADPKATPRRLSLVDASGLLPVLSSQGRLVYTHTTWGDTDIFRIKSTGKGEQWSAPEEFISSTWDELEVKFSPDGKQIAVASRRSGPMQIWVFDADGSNPIALTPPDLKDALHPSWSPDGRWIAFYATSGTNLDVYVVSAAGGPVRRLTDQPGQDINPAWSCDGKYVYFQSDREQIGELWKIPMGGGTAVHAVPRATKETFDCKYLIDETGWPAHYTVWRKPLLGGQTQLLADDVHRWSGFEVFPDGIYYVGNTATPQGYPIVFRDAKNGTIRVLAKVPHPFFGFTVSPDRQTILYAARKLGHSNLMLVESFH